MPLMHQKREEVNSPALKIASMYQKREEVHSPALRIAPALKIASMYQKREEVHSPALRIASMYQKREEVHSLALRIASMYQKREEVHSPALRIASMFQHKVWSKVRPIISARNTNRNITTNRKNNKNQKIKWGKNQLYEYFKGGHCRNCTRDYLDMFKKPHERKWISFNSSTKKRNKNNNIKAEIYNMPRNCRRKLCKRQRKNSKSHKGSTKEVQDLAWLVRKGDQLGIIQEIKIAYNIK